MYHDSVEHREISQKSYSAYFLSMCHVICCGLLSVNSSSAVVTSSPLQLKGKVHSKTEENRPVQ